MTWNRLISFSPECQTFQGLSSVAVGPNGSPTFSTTKAFTNTRTLRIHATLRIGYIFPSTMTQIRTGFWINHAGPTVAQTATLFGILLVGGSYLNLRWNQSTSEIDVTLATVPVDSISVPASLAATDTWMHIGLFYTADSTSGRFILYVNGVEVYAYTGDTGSGATGAYMPSAYATNQNWGSYLYLDDWFVDGGSGNSEGPPPAARFLFALPNAAGDDSQWSVFPSGSNYQAVDEATFDTDTTYVYAASSGLQDLYNFANVTLPLGYSIATVRGIVYGKKSNAAVDTELKLVISDGATDVESSAIDLTTGYTLLTATFDTDPSGTPWTESTVNSTQFGIKSSGTF